MLGFDVPWVVIVLPAILLLLVASWVRYIPNNRIGVVEKRWSSRGSVVTGLIALRGEAGFQPEVLRGGIHLLNRFQYAVHVMPLVTIPQGSIGYVFARDGEPLAPMQTLASNAQADDFLDVRRFLLEGGQRGPQRKVLREGTYAINLAQFVVLTINQTHYLSLNRSDSELFTRTSQLIAERDGFRPIVIRGADDLAGVVTVHDGPSLPQGEIIAPVVGDDPQDSSTWHNNFQEPERFLRAGGQRGRQHQVLVEGTYNINRLFATVEMIPKTVVEVGTVGVVVSYTGAMGDDLSGNEYSHGEMVARGRRGVWSEPLLPGKYAFNTYAGKVVIVPTTNFILKWCASEVGSHRFDENLAEVSLITKDAFEPSLPLSVVVHIDYRKAPLVIQRFGDIKRLVEQTLDPMVSAYFKNVAQTRTLIQLIQDRSAIQRQSADEMRTRFAGYNLELEEVLIGTPTSSSEDKRIDEILKQLRARQIAEEQVETYARQERAAVKERELREAEARAKRQQALTESEMGIAIQSNQGKGESQLALQRAAQVRTMAEAEADKVRLLGEADKVRMLGESEADRAARVGVAQAVAIDEQVKAYGGPKFQLTQQVMIRFAEAVERAGVDVVPRILISGSNPGSGNGPGGSSFIESLLALLLSDRLGDLAPTDTGMSEQGGSLRDQIRRRISCEPASSASSGGDNGASAQS